MNPYNFKVWAHPLEMMDTQWQGDRVPAVDVARILNSPRGWGQGGRALRFVRVDHGPVDFRVSLSSPRLTDAQCAPLRTYAKVSCFNGTRAVER